MIPPVHATRSLLARLGASRSGNALLEFGFSLPIFLSIGVWAIETGNFSLTNLRVSQVALNLADNAARVGLMNALQTEQLREVDMNDVLQATRLQGAPINLTTFGRVTVSSLEADSAGVQSIHWQRCIGVRSGAGYDSSYGTTTVTDGTDTTPANDGTLAPGGMGDAGNQVTAPPNSGVMFVEINYDYQPVIAKWLFGAQKIHYVASFIVRDRRDFSRIFNPSPTATRSTCNLHNA
ncbi:TadE/TadG family type IV pilus assembly protein [uncultured Sphingomonas sp.]|uniref:TadE/TadG family type IV pilus assembly protein n=1 Tax=uncultured Sphingomonas sp. TaxID=158754 RepID=UPI0035CC365A